MSAPATTPVDAGTDPSREHLFGRLALVEAGVRATVALRRAGDPAPDDPFRGLYVSDEQVDKLLDDDRPPVADVDGAAEHLEAVEAAADAAEAAGHRLRLRQLARDFLLEPHDVAILLVALAPDVDARFERLYGYLNDDVTRRRATIGLGFELTGLSPADAAVRARVLPGAPLVEGGLIVVEEPERPFLTRTLRVPDRVLAHLLGDDSPDPALLHVLAEMPPLGAAPGPVSVALGRALKAGARLVHLREKPGAASRLAAVEALLEAGYGAVALDLRRIGPDEDIGALAAVAAREARLRGAGLVAGPVDAISSPDPAVAGGGRARGPLAVRAVAETAGPGAPPVLLYGRSSWDPAWSRAVPVHADSPQPNAEERARTWRDSLDGALADGIDPAAATAHFRLAPEQVVRATRAAEHQAALHGGRIGVADLRLGARSQNAAGLEHLARRVEPDVGWDDLVLPPLVLTHLKELAARARNRDRVLGEWGLRPGGGRGRGIAALFAGDPGTGKTMSAEVIAYELGLDLYSVNLATVVDKYVGETEKNLERIFSEADGVNGVLLFDEADALFGKRSEVKDAHDRYANIETAYLLQRMESFDGLAILSTNLRSNLDEAFARRLDAIVDFPMPEEEYRRVLWDKCLGPHVPRAPDVDLGFLAHQFELSGGAIRAIAVTAAYLAADSGQEVSMADLMRATAREYRKLGRLIVKSEFADFHDMVRSES